MKFKSMGYSEARLEYFRKLKKKHENSLNYWIKKAASSSCHSFDIDDMCSEHGAAINYCESIIEMLENAHAKKNPEWVSVEDRLPPYEWEQNALMATQDVLAINGDGQMFVGYFKVWKYDGSYRFDDGFDHDDITHWMPLPQPPKENET